MAAKPHLRLTEFGESGLGPHGRRCGALPLPKLFEHRGLRRLAAVKFEADGSELRRRQPFVHDVQRRHLFSDEQNGFPAGHRAGDDVGDCLRLPCAGRTLDHEVLASQNLLDRDGLGTVGVRDMDQFSRCKDLIKPVILGDQRRIHDLIVAKITQQELLEEAISKKDALAPAVRFQVPPEQEFGEGEETEEDFIVMDPPAFQAFDRPCHGIEVFTWAPIITLRNLGKLDPELFLQPGLKADVRDEVLIT